MVEVLVATMKQTDMSLRDRMNIRCDCLIANQNGTWGYQEEQTPTGITRMISTGTKGVGINRNLALSNARGDILLLADDDVCYYDGSLQAVEEAFKQFPDADVIAFGMDMVRNGQISAHRHEVCKRRRLWNSMRYGACRIAVRRSAVLRHALSFSELFGGGCPYGNGEDTIFLRECFRKKLKVYSHSYVLGTCIRDVSSWFTGYQDRYFFDYGALLMCAFPKAKHIVKWHFARKFKNKSSYPIMRIIKLMNAGIKGFPLLTVYSERAQNYENL